ncbi:MAG: preprotein translocase subunit TatA [Sulfurovum sp. FS08-3]|nr:MAG: preprotein translocase subunit TatA [Sulfurovum sp. FS08-3]
MGVPSMPELLVILAIVVLLFGAKKIPDLAKGMGKAIKGFKKEMKEDDDEPEIAKKIDLEKKEEKQVVQASTAQETKA